MCILQLSQSFVPTIPTCLLLLHHLPVTDYDLHAVSTLNTPQIFIMVVKIVHLLLQEDDKDALSAVTEQEETERPIEVLK